MINDLIYETLLDQRINLLSQQGQHLHSLNQNINSNTIADSNIHFFEHPHLKMNVKKDKNLPKLIQSITSLRNHLLGLHNPLI